MLHHRWSLSAIQTSQASRQTPSQILCRIGIITALLVVGLSQTGCMEQTRAGVGGDGGMRGGSYTPYRGQYPQAPKESKGYLKDVLHN